MQHDFIADKLKKNIVKKMGSLSKDKATNLLRRQSTVVNSKLANTKGGSDALQIMLGAYGGADADA